MRYVQKVSKDKEVVIQMDTTYWGRNFGLMVIKDAYRNKILWRKYVKYETIADYVEGVCWLRERHRWSARLGRSTENISHSALSISSDDDDKALSYRESGYRSVQRITIASEWHDKNGQRKFYRSS